ncbi:MAG: hypothetical protein GKS06_14765 [Acidobacteria bacterium]|nr:hypothetical protein [Acidobacteriota bacterium]
MSSRAQRVVERFEAGDVDVSTFDHRAHVITGWAMLESYPFLEAVTRFARGLESVASAAGDAEKFNTTITVAFMALIWERMAGEPYVDGDDLCARNPDVLESGILGRYYSRGALWSEASRAAFVLPDRPLPGAA